MTKKYHGGEGDDWGWRWQEIRQQPVAGRFMLGKYLNDKKISWRRRRRLGMVVAGNTPTSSFLTKIKTRCNQQGVGCAK